MSNTRCLINYVQYQTSSPLRQIQYVQYNTTNNARPIQHVWRLIYSTLVHVEYNTANSAYLARHIYKPSCSTFYVIRLIQRSQFKTSKTSRLIQHVELNTIVTNHVQVPRPRIIEWNQTHHRHNSLTCTSETVVSHVGQGINCILHALTFQPCAPTPTLSIVC